MFLDVSWAYNSAAGDPATAAGVFVPVTGLDQTFGTAGVTWLNGEATLPQPGVWKIEGHLSADESAGNNRSDFEARLELNTGLGFNPITGTLGWAYSRNNAQGRGTVPTMALIQANPNDIVRLAYAPRSGPNDFLTLAEGCRLMLTYLGRNK